MNRVLRITITLLVSLVATRGNFLVAQDHDGHAHNHKHHESEKDAHPEDESHRSHEHDERKPNNKRQSSKVDLSEHDHEEHNENFVAMNLEKAKKVGLMILKAGPIELHNRLKLYGETALNSDRIVHVVPRFSGTIKSVQKQLGEPVKKGDVLAIIQSNESLSSYEIKAEIDGVVISKDATQGEFVNEENEIFVIASLDKIWVNVAIFPSDLNRVHLGTPVRVVSDSSQLDQRGKINYIRPTLTEATRTALARIELTNELRKWYPGMFVEVEALLDTEHVSIGVPNNSLVLMENKMSVFVYSTSEDGSPGFEVRHVEVGRTDGEVTEILYGLKPGEEVASGRTFILKAELGKGEAEHEH